MWKGGLAALLTAILAMPSAVAGAFEKDPYLQNVSAHSITVMWQDRPARVGRLILHSDPERIFDVEEEQVHEVVIDDLEPGTRYRFTVQSGDESRDGEFATAPGRGEPFSFVVFGDSRSNARAHARVVERVRQEVPDFVISTGDLVNKGDSSADWDTFFDVESPLLAETVFFPSLGNHDRQGRGRTADSYRRYFSLPENSPDPERYYAFTYGSARFVMLDSNAYSFALTDQTAWIEEQLQAARLDDSIKHIFVAMHHPPYSVSLHGGQDELREAWTPLFETYGVEAVFSGHDHVYSRAHKNGVHYFVSGGGGAPLYGRKKNSDDIDLAATQFFERVNHHLRVHVVGDHVEIVAVRADGTVIEGLSWGELPEPDAEKLLAIKARSPAASAVGAGPSKDVKSGKVEPGPPNPSGSKAALGVLGLMGLALSLGALVVGLWVWRQ